MNDRLSAVAERVKEATQGVVRGSRHAVEATFTGLRTHGLGAVRLIKNRLGGRNDLPGKRLSAPPRPVGSADSRGPAVEVAPASGDRPAPASATPVKKAPKKAAKKAVPAKQAADPVKKAAKKAAAPAKKAAVAPAKKAAKKAAPAKKATASPPEKAATSEPEGSAAPSSSSAQDTQTPSSSASEDSPS